MREGPLDYDVEGYAEKYTLACKRATRPGILGPCMIIRKSVFDRIGLFDETFIFGGCEDVDFLWRAWEVGITSGVTGSSFIHHFGMVTQNVLKKARLQTYPLQNLQHFQRKWGRTIRGNWMHRRWVGLRDTWMEWNEKLRYGHMLIEKPRKP